MAQSAYSKEELDVIKKIKERWRSEPEIWDNLLGDIIQLPSGEIIPKHVSDTSSFIYQVTKNNVFIKDITPLSVDGPDSSARGNIEPGTSEISDWYYYVFDYRNFQNIFPQEPPYTPGPDSIIESFEWLSVASFPYAVSLWGKKWIQNLALGMSKAKWVRENIQFGGYEFDVRTTPDEPLNVVNPGLTFLIGLRKSAVDALEFNDEPRIPISDLVPEKAIIVRTDSIDKEFDKVAIALETYHRIREKMVTPFTVVPEPFNFKHEAKLVRQFKSALKTLLQNASSGCEKIWNKPGNIIEIMVTKETNQVAYVREYAPEDTFRKNLSTLPGITGIRQLGKVKSSRIIGGGMSNDLKKYFLSFKERPGVRNSRTVVLISRMHGRNGENEGIKPYYNINPGSNVPRLNIFDFIRNIITPENSDIQFQHDDPTAHHRSVIRHLDDNGGPMATPVQRASAAAKFNNPSWVAQYEHYTKNAFVDMADNFFASIPEKLNSLNAGSESFPYDLDVIFNEILNKADVKRLTLEAIKCRLGPNEWLETAGRYAMRDIGPDVWFENMQNNGILDALRNIGPEISEQITNAFNVIEEQKKIAEGHIEAINDTKEDFINQLEDLLSRKEELESQLLNTLEETLSEQSRLALKSINSAIEEVRSQIEQADLDLTMTQYNKGVDALMPISESDPEVMAQVAQASKEVVDIITNLKDPDLQREIYANMANSSSKATSFLSDMFDTGTDFIENLFEQPEQPKEQTDDFGMYWIEVVRDIVASALSAIIFSSIRKVLHEIVGSCHGVNKNILTHPERENKTNKTNKTPGKARFNDLLAQTPTKAARDLTTKLSGFIDVADPNVVSSLLGLMEDLELLLSQIELCALIKGEASIKVLKIVKNLIKIKNNKLYLELKDGTESLSFAKITDFFKNFEPLIKSGYCEEIQKPDEQLQLYHECPIYVRELHNDLLIGHATLEQIENITRRARAEKLDELNELIDIAYNPEYTAIPDPRNPNSPNAIPHDIYPVNAILEKLMDQNLGPIADSYKQEMLSFSNRLLVGNSNGFVDLDPAALTDMMKNIPTNPAAERQKIKESHSTITKILPTIKASLVDNPMEWTPNIHNSTIMSDFSISAETLEAQSYVKYYITDNINYPQAINLWYRAGSSLGDFGKEDPKGYILYPIKNGKVVFLPVARMESFLNLYGSTAAYVKEGKLNLEFITNSPDEVYINKLLADTTLDPETELIASPAAEKFYELINEKWMEDHSPVGGVSSLEESKQGLKFLFNIVTRDIGNHIFEKISNSVVFKKEGHEALEKFFSTFVPQEAFLADESCDVIEASLMKIGDLKAYVRDRNKDLSSEPAPNLNEETPNFARAQAEGVIIILARICAFETVLRLLPISASIKMKEMLSSEPIINVVIEHLLYELAMLDYKKTYKTLSTREARRIQNLKPTKCGLFDPDSGKLKYNLSPSGKKRYTEEPPTPAIASENNKPFKPKFQAHVVNYANKIMQSRMQKQTKKGKTLVDPITTEDYVHSDDPYSLNGLAYLIKEQMVPISEFVEKEFEPLFKDIEIKSFERFALETFLYKDHLKLFSTAANPPIKDIFDLMPSIHPDSESELLNPDSELNIKMNRRLYYALTIGGLGAARRSSVPLDNGGFLLEPYIRVKQNKAINPDTDITFDPETEAAIKEEKAQEAYKFKIEEGLAEVVAEQCNELPGEPGYQECKQDVISKNAENIQKLAQIAYNNTINTPLSDLLSITGELNPLFGHLDKGNGAYININQWRDSMANAANKLGLNSEIADEPHTNWFDPWMYGLRLVYIAPLKDTNNDIKSNNGELEIKYDELDEKVLKGFNSFADIADIAHDKDDPWGIINKKTYVLEEEDPIDQSEVTSPIFSVPLIEVEIPVGSLMSGEKNLAKKIIMDKAEAEGENPGQAGSDFEEELKSAVPMGYFTYQAGSDDYPLEQLICAMVQTDDYNKIFGVKDESVFPLDNYKTLLGLHILAQTFSLGEYKEQYFGLFESTKARLRSIFYSNVLAHDHTKGGSSLASRSSSTSQHYQASMLEEASGMQGTSGISCHSLADSMFGDFPSLAKILSMIPVGHLKAWVNHYDPYWKWYPATQKGWVMFSIYWGGFIGGFGGWLEEAGVNCSPLGQLPSPPAGNPTLFDDYPSLPPVTKNIPKTKALACPDTVPKKAEYTNDELEFIEMMKSYGVPEGDRNYVLHTVYLIPNSDLTVTDSPPFPGWGYFKDTLLFEALVKAWKEKSDDELKKLGIIFNNLREYYDTYVEVYSHLRVQHVGYLRHANQIIGVDTYYNPDENYWIAGSEFEEVLFVVCGEISDLRYNGYAYAKTVCEAKNKYNLATNQLIVLDKLFNTILSQINLGYGTYSAEKLIDPTDMFKPDLVDGEKVPLLDNISTPSGQEILFPETEGLSEKQIVDSIHENNLSGPAFPHKYIPKDQLADKIANILMLLVWNNNQLFNKNETGINSYNKGLVMSPQSHNNWRHTPNKPVNFNFVGSHNMRQFWITDSWEQMIGDWDPDTNPEWMTPPVTWHGNLGSDSVTFINEPNPSYWKLFANKAAFDNLDEGVKKFFVDDVPYTYVTMVDNQLDALIKGSAVNLIDKYVWESSQHEPSSEDIQALLSADEVYDMYNPDDYKKIGSYWMDFVSAAGRFAVQERASGESTWSEGPASKWKFVDLRTNHQTPVLVLDTVAWYYPSLAGVIAEMLYKIYNIKLETQCINVSEIKSQPTNPNNPYWLTSVNISIKHGASATPANQYASTPFNVNKKAIINDLNSGRFII